MTTARAFRLRMRSAFVPALMLFTFLARCAAGADYTLLGGSGAVSFDDPAAWSPTGVPEANDTVLWNWPLTDVLYVQSAPTTVAALTVAGPATYYLVHRQACFYGWHRLSSLCQHSLERLCHQIDHPKIRR